MRYFVKVAELGSLSRAAVALFIAQPPLSRQIQALEEEVGTPLLFRSAKGVTLTAAGRVFLADCKAMLAQAERAKFNAKRAADTEDARLNIGFIPSAAHFVLPNLLCDLRSHRADAQLRAQEMLSTEQAAALHSGQIDIGISRWTGADPSLEDFCSLSDPFCLVVPCHHPLAKKRQLELTDARHEAFASYLRDQPRAYFDPTMALCDEAGFKPNIAFEVSSTYALIDIVATGAAIALVPGSSVLFANPRVRFRRIDSFSRSASLVLIRRRNETAPFVHVAEEAGIALFEQVRRTMHLRIK
ncbi:LysR family transcriptional regulator [Pseudomonas sp. LRF_L74]|uniref:LysR family transcriptional regulator n=1 Tax=Pseudomonas sp. LRF_L74 TaxID=3369422 RepID=UPI003F5FDC7E